MGRLYAPPHSRALGVFLANSISVTRAIAIGLLVVNGPLLPIMFLPMILLFPAITHFENNNVLASLLIFFSALFFGFLAAWCWWSFTIPKWRLWAYEKVQDISLLKQKAVGIGLVWPDGHFFEKTEFKSAEHEAREKAFENDHT